MAVINYNKYTLAKKGVKMPQKKRGRPVTDNPKTVRVDVRLTQEELKILDEYCIKNDVSRPQGLRDGIKTLNKK